MGGWWAGVFPQAHVALTAALLYLNTLRNGCVFDDRPAIIRNPCVGRDDGWTLMLVSDFWGAPVGSARSHGSYRPLTVFTLWLNRQLDFDGGARCTRTILVQSSDPRQNKPHPVFRFPPNSVSHATHLLAICHARRFHPVCSTAIRASPINAPKHPAKYDLRGFIKSPSGLPFCPHVPRHSSPSTTVCGFQGSTLSISSSTESSAGTSMGSHCRARARCRASGRGAVLL